MKRNGDILQTLWQHRKFSILFLFSTFLAVSPYFWQTLEMWALILFFSLKKKIKSVEKNYLVSLHINTFQNIWKLKKQHTFFYFFEPFPQPVEELLILMVRCPEHLTQYHKSSQAHYTDPAGVLVTIAQ